MALQQRAHVVGADEELLRHAILRAGEVVLLDIANDGDDRDALRLVLTSRVVRFVDVDELHHDELEQAEALRALAGAPCISLDALAAERGLYELRTSEEQP